MTNDHIKAFLSELTELSKRYRIEIDLATNITTGADSICISEIKEGHDLSKFSYSVLTDELDEFSAISNVIGDHLSLTRNTFKEQIKGEA